jgi:hypothetical protein
MGFIVFRIENLKQKSLYAIAKDDRRQNLKRTTF